MTMAKLFLTVSLAFVSLTAFGKPTNADIWCMVPENFNGRFAANLYVAPNHSADFYVILAGNGASASTHYQVLKKVGNSLIGGGFVGEISKLQKSRFVANQIEFDLKITANVPTAPMIGAPSVFPVTLECAGWSQSLKNLE